MSFSCGHHGWRHALSPCPICHPDVKPTQSMVPELKAEEIVKPMSIFDEISPEELLFYATPYYDELQRKKEQHAQQLKEEALNGEENRKPKEHDPNGRKGESSPSA